MASPINLETLEHLAALARLELEPEEKEKFLKDLERILEHVSELQKIDLQKESGSLGAIKPFLTDVFRADGERENTNQGAGKESFPETQKGFLKVPPVFDNGN